MAGTRGVATAAATKRARSAEKAAPQPGPDPKPDEAKLKIDRLESDAKQRLAELAIVNEIIHSLARQRDFGQIVEAVGEAAASALNVRGMSICTVEPDTNELIFHFWIDEGVRAYEREGTKLDDTFDDTLSRQVLDANKPLRINSAEEAAARGTPFWVGDTQSYLGVPIPAGDRAIGVFALGTREENAYSDADEQLVTTMASAMGVALDNARLAASTRQRVAELAIVNEVNQAVGAQLGPDAVIRLVGDRILETFDADVAYVALRHEPRDPIDFPYYNAGGDRTPPMAADQGDGLAARILDGGQPLLIGPGGTRLPLS
jgi:hypothetical protein